MLRKSGWSRSLTKHIPPGQLARYLLVGAWNTLFGYGTYALFTALLAPVVPHSYVVALVLSSLLNITVSYFGIQVVRLQDQRKLPARVDAVRRGV